MAYKKDKLYKEATDAAKKHNLFFIEDIVSWLSCGKTTFYKYFPEESNELNELKVILDSNKIRTKSIIRAKLFKGEKAAELLALYRLICTPEEHQKLNQQYIDHSSKDGSMSPNLSNLSNEELAKRLNLVSKLEKK